VDRIVGQMRTQLQDAWTEVRSGEGPVWRRKNFWLALAALFLPGGWLLLLVSLVPVRIRTERRS
jgi:hypothetical protein